MQDLSIGIYISRSVFQEGDIAMALVIFAEFQHSEGLGEQAAQNEFIQIRDALPDNLRTPYINNLHHGGTENE